MVQLRAPGKQAKAVDPIERDGDMGAEHIRKPITRPDLARREAYLAAVVEVQRILLASEGKDLPLGEICSILGSVFHASRVYLVGNDYDLDERMFFQRQFEWCAANIQSRKDAPDLQRLYYDEIMPGWYRQLTQGKLISGVLADFPAVERRFLITQGVQAVLIFPLMVGGRFVGFLAFEDCLIPRQWQPSEISLLQVVTTSIAMVRERLETEEDLSSAYRELSQRLVELSTLNEIIQTVATIQDLHQVLNLIATKTSLVFEAVSCSIALLNSEQSTLRIIVHYRREPDQVSMVGEYLPLEDNTAFQRVVEQQQPLVITHAQEDPMLAMEYDLLKKQGIQCILLTPLLSRGKVLGIIWLNLDNCERIFSHSEVRLAETIAGQVAGAIENARLFQEAELARSAAVSSSQAKSAFLASMSHELRTPLNAILGFTQLLLHSTNLTPEQRESLNTINRSGDHLLTLINDILDLSKIEAGRITLQESEFDLHHLLVNVGEMFSLRIKDKGLLFRLAPEPNTPRFIHSDESKLRQILINLLGNAIKFTSRGSITLAIRSEPVPAGSLKPTPGRPALRNIPRLRLIFEVTDTGIGIPTEDLERIFEPFVQSRPVSRSVEGTGLGLAISREYARLLGGEITAHSRLGFGSTFHVEVLVAKAATGDLPMAPLPSRVTGLAPGQAALRLLVAEDNEANRQLLVLLLSSVGFEVRGVENGLEAVQAAREWKPHLVWMDIRLPVLDGFEATRQIKAMGSEAPVVIALTASVLEDERGDSLAAGCDDYLSKPYREAEIFDRLERHLGVRFTYEMQAGSETEELFQAATGLLISAQNLEALPVEVLQRLGTAALGGDILSLESAIQDIRRLDAPLAASLDRLANQFEYSKIHALTQEALQRSPK
jgi:signal transduction histidine kinase/DNA-binding NarL/FixJ family response regulator